MNAPSSRLALLLVLAAAPALLGCPPAGECQSDTDCAEGEACRESPTQGRVCIEVIDDTGGDAGPEPAVAITSFAASPGTIDASGAATLAWETENATSCAIDNGVGGVDKSGQVEVTPAESTTYTLSCQGADGPALAEAEVKVRVEIASFGATPVEANEGDEVTFAWQTVSAESCGIAFGDVSYAVLAGDVPAGSHPVQAARSGTATLTCEGADGPATATVDVDVASVVSLLADPPALAAGQSTLVSWSVEHLTGCALRDITDADPNDDSASVTLQQTAALSLVCTGFGSVEVQRDLVVPVLILSFAADSAQVASGESATLSFSVDPLVSSCDVNGDAVDLGAGAFTSAALTQSTDFVLTCETDDGLSVASDPVTVTVQ